MKYAMQIVVLVSVSAFEKLSLELDKVGIPMPTDIQLKAIGESIEVRINVTPEELLGYVPLVVAVNGLQKAIEALAESDPPEVTVNGDSPEEFAEKLI